MRRIHHPAWKHTALGALLLALMVACGFARTGHEADRVEVPVTRMTLGAQDITANAMQDTREKLNRQREKELEMLDAVLAHASTDEQTAANALAHKAALVHRMECEAQVRACLEYMGFSEIEAVCGAQTLTLFVPGAAIQDDKARIAMIDAVCSQTGMGAESVKIILAKNN